MVYRHWVFFFCFQALADRIAVSCSLVRGEYNRAWNEVMLCEDAKVGEYKEKSVCLFAVQSCLSLVCLIPVSTKGGLFWEYSGFFIPISRLREREYTELQFWWEQNSYSE